MAGYSMTEEEFLNKIQSLKDDRKISLYRIRNENKYDEKTYLVSNKKALLDHYIEIKWEVGGASGGNCWGHYAEEYTITEINEPDFNDLDQILSYIVPKISYLNYKSIAKTIESG